MINTIYYMKNNTSNRMFTPIPLSLRYVKSVQKMCICIYVYFEFSFFIFCTDFT